MPARSRLAVTSLALLGSAASALLLAGPALAHVTASAPSATQGGDATVTFTVPTESDTASTVGLRVQMPTDTPIASVAVQPKPGWTFTTKKGKPATPVSGDSGPVTEVVTEVDWKVTAGGPGIKPGEFDTFLISVGPLPKTNIMTFKAIQSYSDGTSVAWIETPAPGSTAEPAHPAPTISLAPAENTGGASASTSPSTAGVDASSTTHAGGAVATDKDSNALAITALSIGIVALLVGVGALIMRFTAGKNVGGGSLSS
jgi:uncharacterized protein